MKTKIKLPLLFLALLACGIARSQCNDSIIVVPGYFGNYSFGDYPISFDSSNANNITWNFGDGTTLQDSDFYPYYVSHQFLTSDTEVVCATDNTTGCTACATIAPNICAGSIYFSSTITGFGTYSFSANANGMPGTLQAVWSFGDGDSAFTMNPVHQYAANGTYHVCLVLINPSNGGCSNSSCQDYNVVICNYPIVFTDSINSTPANGPFAVTSPVPGYVYNWIFGDGTTGTGDTVVHEYAVSGSYNVCVAVSNPPSGCTDTSCEILYVARCNISPVIGAYDNGLTVSYQCTMNDSTVPVTFSWTFPGGTPSTSTDENPEVTYSAYGTVTAQLIVTADGNCSDTLSYTATAAPPTYTIQGTIWDGAVVGCGTVYLITEDSTQSLVLYDSLITSDSLGQCFGFYYFSGLPANTYYVKAALDSSDPNYSYYLPTYFGNVLHWADATPINVAGGNQGGDINMIAGTNPGGPGFIAGLVSQGAGIVAKGGGQNILRGTDAVGDPLANIQINLLTSDNTPVTYTYTDATGHFTFKNIALGSYQVYAEDLNRKPAPIPVEITQDNPNDTTLHISVTSSSATGINTIGNVTLSSVYPNPAATSFTLQLSSTQNLKAALKLLDVLGREVQQQQMNIVTGNNTAEMNIEQLPAGVYELVIQTSSGRLTLPVVKAK